jgi:hypothetical protein
MNCWIRISFCFSWLWLSFVQPMQAQHFVELIEPHEITLAQGEKHIVSLNFLIKEGFHIQADKVRDKNFIPTVLTFEDRDDIHLGDPVFPKADEFHMEGAEEPMVVFGQELEIQVPITVLDFKKDIIPLEGKLYYQACDEKKCYFPRDLNFKLKVLKPIKAGVR